MNWARLHLKKYQLSNLENPRVWHACQPIPEAAYSVGVVYLTLLVLLDRKGVPVDALAEDSTSENNSKFMERE